MDEKAAATAVIESRRWADTKCSERRRTCPPLSAYVITGACVFILRFALSVAFFPLGGAFSPFSLWPALPFTLTADSVNGGVRCLTVSSSVS